MISLDRLAEDIGRHFKQDIGWAYQKDIKKKKRELKSKADTSEFFPEKNIDRKIDRIASIKLTRKKLARKHTSSAQADISRFLLKRH